MNEPTNQSSHRPLREGERIEETDLRWNYRTESYEMVPASWVGLLYGEEFHTMRRPVKD